MNCPVMKTRSLLTLREEREILTAKLDYRNALNAIARAVRLQNEGMVARSELSKREALLALLKLVVPFATVSGEYAYELLAMHGEDGQEMLNELRLKIAKRNVSELVDVQGALEYPDEVARLLR